MALVRDLVQNLRTGMCVALFLPVRRDLRPTLDQAVLLLALGISIIAVLDFVAAGPKRIFFPLGATVLTFDICVLLLASYLAARLHRAHASFTPLLFVVLYFLPVVWLTGLLALKVTGQYDSDLRGYLVAALSAWALILGWRAVRLVRVTGRVRATACVAIIFAGMIGPETLFSKERYRIWYQPPPVAAASKKVAKRPRLNVERTYYAQRRLVRQALRDISPGRPGITDLYFVGFAGDASQAVFRREVLSVRTLFDDRFDTARRSVALINHRETVDRLPLASTYNLGGVLGAVGKRMDRDEDVLFLFLTSHGSRTHRLTVRFRPLGLNDLSPATLREILDRAAIKWRVIVVSACYSGGFIDALKNENTLIMTAARRDRTSFGCGDDNDFTYFGRAYFDQALRRTMSFTAAFDQARIAVTEREQAQDFKPSEPQIFVGKAIKPKLAALEARLAAQLDERERETAER